MAGGKTDNKIAHSFDGTFKEILAGMKDEKILLHCCCAPCFSGCIERLPLENVTAYFFNPNIMPAEEYSLRAENMRRLCQIYGVNYIKEVYDEGHPLFLKAVQGLETCREGEARCEKCFYLRLFAAATRAKQEGMDYFCTTLTLSPHKNADLINKIGFEIEKTVGVLYLPADFKKGSGYQRSIQLCKEHEIYRQNYCGCRF